MSKKTVRKNTVSTEEALLDDHDLTLQLIAEHTALAEEIFRLIRDVRKHLSLVSTLFTSEAPDAQTRPWNRPCPPFKM